MSRRLELARSLASISGNRAFRDFPAAPSSRNAHPLREKIRVALLADCVALVPLDPRLWIALFERSPRARDAREAIMHYLEIPSVR